MPDMQPLNGTSLPFRELHEAIFGKALRMSSSHHQVDPGTTAIPKIQQRKNSGCSVNFLNSFLNLGLASGYEQYGGGGLGNHPNAQSNLYDPMISGETNGRLLKTSDMATPSISAPGSSPTLSASDDLFQLHNALRNGQTPNAAAVEAMAARLSSALSPAELDLLIQNVATPKKDVDFFSNPDLAALLFPGTETAGNSVNPMELLSCLPHSSDQFLYSSTFADDHIEQQFS